MTLYSNKYRVESARLKHWNYANNGMYFITICTDDKIRNFGNIIDENVMLNKLGKFATQCWEDIPNHFPFVELNGYIIMPNHIHGIIGIDNDNVETRHALSQTKGNQYNINTETGHALSLQQHPRFRNQGKNSISAIVGSFKSAVTKYANKNNIPFKWQTRFYNRVIRACTPKYVSARRRDENELFNIQRYVIENPLKWKLDKYYINS